MDKREIFVKMASIEERIGDLYKEIGELKDVIVVLMEENAQLLVENQHLRNRLDRKKTTAAAKQKGTRPVAQEKAKKTVVGEGYDNLARLYAEGFHICNVHFGSLRKEGDCLFCLSFLSGGPQK
ncbi:DNA replication initiation control protein YabA [Brevibacillus sp. GCM10020057]|uniref:DNA replication initiation control protein YabA n=1 Tax=Brevibacillus sp. GCM10020057 TaxID=3317327 RepID=UPI00362CC930